MQIVTFETANRLKEAGFPQPSEILKGNDAKNRWNLFYVSPEYEDEEGINVGPFTADRIEDIRGFGDPCEVVAFAPTATDLIPPGWHLVRAPKESAADYAGEWTCSAIDVDCWYHNDNPAEAAAFAWLHVNSKKDRNQSNV